MRPDPRFASASSAFWAQVKLISLELGYSERARQGQQGRMKRYAASEVLSMYKRRGLDTDYLGTTDQPSEELRRLLAYLNFRASTIENDIRPLLMNREEAQSEFERLFAENPAPRCHLPMNKQRGDKAHYSYLTGIVNLLTEASLGKDSGFIDNPGGPVTVTVNRRPSRTLSRRMDGAYPTLNNPRACWEIKEYYGTTTFGSRVADGIYETIMDGLEIAELQKHLDRRLLHYLVVDDRFTWWDKGRSYLCRIVDMVHMDLVDEALFGREVLTRWPEIVRSWQIDSDNA